jgi:hypothetical protein
MLGKTIYAFLKFGKWEHLHEFRTDGLVYLNTLRYFQELESDPERGDPFEGIDTITQPQHIRDFVFDTNSKRGKIVVSPEELAGPIRISRNRTMACNVYCLFSITEPVCGDLVSERSSGLGDSCVLVLNPTELVTRISNAAKAATLNCHSGMVRYYDSRNYSGEVGPFRKRAEYSYQNEFRFVVWPGGDVAIRLKAGSLLDITSEVIPMDEANTRMDFSMESFREAGLSA